MLAEEARQLMARLSAMVPVLVYLAVAAYIGFRIVSFYSEYVGLINGLLE